LEARVERNPYFIPNHFYKISILGFLKKEDEAQHAKSVMENMNPDYKASATYVFYTDEHSNNTRLSRGYTVLTKLV